MQSTIIPFPNCKPPRVLQPQPGKLPPSIWRSGKQVRHLTKTRSVGIIRAVYICPLFHTVSAIKVDFDTVSEWCKPADLEIIPRWEMF